MMAGLPGVAATQVSRSGRAGDGPLRRSPRLPSMRERLAQELGWRGAARGARSTGASGGMPAHGFRACAETWRSPSRTWPSSGTLPTTSAGSARAPMLRWSEGEGAALSTRSAKPDAMTFELSTESQSTTRPHRIDWRTMDSRQARRVRAPFFVGTTTVTLALVIAHPALLEARARLRCCRCAWRRSCHPCVNPFEVSRKARFVGAVPAGGRAPAQARQLRPEGRRGATLGTMMTGESAA